MADIIHILERIGSIDDIGIALYEKDHLRELHAITEKNPLAASGKLCSQLIEQSKGQEIPLIYLDEHSVCFGCIRCGENFYLFGPMALKRMTQIEVHRYYRAYNIPMVEEMAPHHYTFGQVISLMGLFAELIMDKEYTDKELIMGNHLMVDEAIMEKEKILFRLQKDEEDIYHHTYAEERKILACVREGRMEEAQRRSMDTDMSVGRLSRNELTHWKSMVIVAITLCVRATIEAGISPVVAYQLSDFFIQKSDQCRTIPELIALRSQAIAELTMQVRQRMEQSKGPGYIDQCRDYINKHYREKIYLDDIADTLGISSAYLSKIFARETGMRIQDYIVTVRVEHAANLLVYSEESISHIGEYVNFPTQSYFGKVFKKLKGLTPKEYRDKYKTREFSS